MSKEMLNSTDPAENLHKIAQDTGKKSVDTFVNPGTPENPLVGMADRKTGQISGTADSKLRSHMQPKK